MLLLTWFIGFALATPLSSKNRNVHIIGKYENAKNEMEFLLDISEVSQTITQDPNDYSLNFNNGIAKGNPFLVEDISLEKKTTVFVFDDSKSMKSPRPVMIQAAKKFLNSLTPAQKKDHTIDILIGAMSTTVIGEDLSPADAIVALDLLPEPSQKNTALRDIIVEAIEKSTEANKIEDGGLRQVIVFSDGLEESDFEHSDAATLIDKAQIYGVQVHFLFNSPLKELPPSDIAKIDRMQSVADATGGVSQTEDVKKKNGNLDKGAIEIANKLGKVVRVRTTLCEVTTDDAHAVAKISFGTMDYAYVGHDLNKTNVNEQQCACPTACQANEICKHGACVVNPQAKQPAQTQTPTSTTQTPTNWYDDWWWLPLLLGTLLLGFLLWKLTNKDGVGADGADGGDGLPPPPPPPPAPTPAPTPSSLFQFVPDLDMAAWSTVGKLYQGFPQKKSTSIHGFTMMHKRMLIGNPHRRGMDMTPTHATQVGNIQRGHLQVELLPGREKRIRLTHPEHNSPIFIENRNGSGEPTELYNSAVIDPVTQMVCMWTGTNSPDNKNDDRIFLVFETDQAVIQRTEYEEAATSKQVQNKVEPTSNLTAQRPEERQLKKNTTKKKTIFDPKS